MIDKRSETLAYLMEQAVETGIPSDVRKITAIAEEAGEVVGAFNKWCEMPPRASHMDFLQELAQLQIVLDLAVSRYGHGQWATVLDTEYERQIQRFKGSVTQLPIFDATEDSVRG